MEDKKRIWVWVGVAVVVIAVVIIVVPKSSHAPTSRPAAPNNPPPVYAAQGQLVPQFPQQLILDNATSVSSSYSISYSSSTNQYSAEFNSSDSMLKVYADYKSYLVKNGWTITNDIDNNAYSRGLYTSNASSNVVLAILSKGEGSQVIISYVTK